MNFIEAIFGVLRNKVLNSMGVERDLMQLVQDKDISRIQSMMQNRDLCVEEAIKEYNPITHDVMNRPDKMRKGKEPYKVEKLPRCRQRYINEVELFFLLGNPIKWKTPTDEEGRDEAFEAYTQFLKDTRFNTTMRQAKRIAGAETESAKVYHIYNDGGKPAVKVLVISKSKGYTLRPLFDQYENLIAFGYGYYIKEGDKTVEHFDLHTPSFIFRCRKADIGWEVIPVSNPTGKINVIYYCQEKAWAGTERRCSREEMIDSKAADTNNYFADPKLKATADVIESLRGAETVGEVLQLTNKEISAVDYLVPPEYSSMKESEKKDLNSSILFDSFTPDFSFENMKGLGTLSGEALKRAMVLGFIKRDNLKETYDILVDREKNLIVSIMMNVTHVQLREKLSKMVVEHEFSEPFSEDVQEKWASIGKAYKDGIISLEQAVNMLALADNPQEEIERIKSKNQEEYQDKEGDYPPNSN